MDTDESKLEKLVNQCKNNDIDVKIDALTKLEAEFVSGIEIIDVDSIINVLKSCLRTSNQHLSAATLSALPPFLPLVVARTGNALHSQHASSPTLSTSTASSPSAAIDAAILRQILNAFLPAGGLVDRLGDKEKSQLKARESLVILGGLAFRSGGSSMMSTGSKLTRGPENPIAMFERFLREVGLASKVWKVREQSILTLVHIRRKHHLFPIRPYLTPLVEALEDTDAHVRDCSRQSVVELFSGPGVTDGARADLKKELTKKGVRKTIVDGVLSKLLSSSSSSSGPQSREGSENGDATGKAKEYIPPSMALKSAKIVGILRSASQGSIPRPASRGADTVPSTPTTETASEVKAVYIASSKDLESEFAGMAKSFEGKETEHNWAQRDQAVSRVRGMLKGDVHLRYNDAFINGLKDGFIQWSLKTLASLRTTVATNTCSLYTELVAALGMAMDPFCEVLLTSLLKMAGFTKKITAQQSQVCVTSLIMHTSGTPRLFVPLLWQGIQDKMVQARSYVVAHIKTYLEVHGHRSKSAIESSGSLETLEKALLKALVDPNPAVKDSSRACFWVFEEIWRDRGLAIMEKLTPQSRKQLENACPNPDIAASLPIATPKPAKKTSIAAAIAASRAKAKVIATAPPSLRHQATSSSSHTPMRTVSSPNMSSKTFARPASPLRLSTSPPSPRSRTVANGQNRTVSQTTATSSHSRSPSGGAGSTSPPSPDQHSFHRRLSSPLAPSASSPSIRKALQNNSSPVQKVTLTSRNSTRAVPAAARDSFLFPDGDGHDDSLLLAQTIPVPEDSDSENSVNLMSFSAAYEKYSSPPPPPRSDSQALSFSPKSVDSKPMPPYHALSADNLAQHLGTSEQPVVEDALRARAEQAESAAERLLELVDPEEEGIHHSTIPESLLVGSKVKAKPSPLPIGHAPRVPATPVNRNTAVLRQAALFKDSPAHTNRPPSLLDVLQDRKHESGWWLKRKAVIAQRFQPQPLDPSEQIQELHNLTALLVADSADVAVLQRLTVLCLWNPATDATSPISPEYGYPSSPSPFMTPSRSLPSGLLDIWETNKGFERLFNALMKFLEPTKSEAEIEYGLILLWEMLENQAIYIEGCEADIFSLLLQVRYCNKLNVLEATNTIRDALTTRIEPIYGLTTMHASLRAFQAESPPTAAEVNTKAASYAFGLIALGKFILRLPGEIAEEEIPRLRSTLIFALNDKSSLVVRESAAAVIIAAQLVLRDETHLFTLLDGLADEKKNLLTYLFDKHGARGVALGNGADKLEKEMRRLDGRTSTPPRPSLG